MRVLIAGDSLITRAGISALLTESGCVVVAEVGVSSAPVQRKVSVTVDRHGMSCRQRQLDELRDLCRSGAAIRAIDLAFEHFAQFGRDDDILDLLAEAVEHAAPTERARHRFSELRALHDGRPVNG